MEELTHFVFYDIEVDKIRNKIADICKDYGLERIQFSGFSGKLSKNKRDELFLKLTYAVQEGSGKILILPLCEKDFKQIKEFIHLEDKKNAETDTTQGE